MQFLDKVLNSYDIFLKRINEHEQKKRYKGYESYFHASSAGHCIKKHKFAKERIQPELSLDTETLRTFRMGNLIHDDLQTSLYENDPNIKIELEVLIKKYNVRGFLDIFDSGNLIDIKTIKAYKWRKLFGHIKNRDKNPSIKYELQNATYNIGLKETYDIDVKDMYLLYYCKKVLILGK